jgi:hypothetical protein
LLVLCLIQPTALPAQEPARWTVERVGRIGSQDDPEQSLTRITGILIGPDNELYVAQPMDRTVRVFSADGRLLRSIGRQGGGPGEFDLKSGFGTIGESIFVSDNRYNRVTFFSWSGSTLATMNLVSPTLQESESDIPFYGPTTPYAFFDDGTALVVPSVPVMLVERGSITRVPYLRIDRSGRLLDTLAWNGMPPRAIEVSHDGARFFARLPFVDAPLMEPMRDGSGIAIVERPIASSRDRGNFRVLRVRPTGDTAFDRTIAYRPVPLPDQVLAAKLAGIRETMQRRGSPPATGEIERALRGADAIPATLPPVSAVVTAQDGTIWLRREESAGPEQPWLVVSGTGETLATVLLPAGVEVSNARGDVLVAIETDDLDVQYIVLYRIRRS